MKRRTGVDAKAFMVRQAHHEGFLVRTNDNQI
jgi:hypothetical protein